MNRNQSQGFAHVFVLVLLVLVIAASAFGGWYVWKKNHKATPATSNNSPNSQNNTNQSKQEPVKDPSEGGKYLVIREWGVRALLPTDLRGGVDYSLGQALEGPDGNRIQSAKILIKKDLLVDSQCAYKSGTAIGNAIETGAQYIRSESNKPFDAARYKWTFKQNILSATGYSFHINYVTAICLDNDDDATKIERLHVALESLIKSN